MSSLDLRFNTRRYLCGGFLNLDTGKLIGQRYKKSMLSVN